MHLKTDVSLDCGDWRNEFSFDINNNRSPNQMVLTETLRVLLMYVLMFESRYPLITLPNYLDVVKDNTIEFKFICFSEFQPFPGNLSRSQTNSVHKLATNDLIQFTVYNPRVPD